MGGPNPLIVVRVVDDYNLPGAVKEWTTGKEGSGSIF